MPNTLIGNTLSGSELMATRNEAEGEAMLVAENQSNNFKTTLESLPPNSGQIVQGPVPAPRRRRTSSTEMEQLSQSSPFDSCNPPPIAAPRTSFRKGSRDNNRVSNGNSEMTLNGTVDTSVDCGTPGSPLPTRQHAQMSSSKPSKPFQGKSS